MHFTSTLISTVAFLMLGVKAVALPQNNGLTKGASAEAGTSCEISGERTCNGARDQVLTCLGAPGTALSFSGTLGCIPGFQVCVDGDCVVEQPAEEPLTGEGGEGGEGLTIGNGNTTDE